jgi:formylglycine-generating enzyme required for sulfatase activity
MNKKYTWTLLASITMIMVITFAYAPHDAGELIRSGPYRGMVYIPGGTFTYKSSGTDVEDIIESREVTIDAFYMDETEITNKQYRILWRLPIKGFRNFWIQKA